VSACSVAIDLGCGDGAETLELLRRGWTVLAVDGSSAGIARLRQSVSPADLPRLTTLVAPFTAIRPKKTKSEVSAM
jgi:tellurite methyltransferase